MLIRVSGLLGRVDWVSRDPGRPIHLQRCGEFLV